MVRSIVSLIVDVSRSYKLQFDRRCFVEDTLTDKFNLCTYAAMSESKGAVFTQSTLKQIVVEFIVEYCNMQVQCLAQMCT